MYKKMQRERLYNLHTTAFFHSSTCYFQNGQNYVRPNFNRVEKRYFFWYWRVRFFLFHLFIIWYVLLKEHKIPQSAAWKALQFTQDSFSYSCTFCFQNRQNSKQPNVHAAKKIFFGRWRARFFILVASNFVDFEKKKCDCKKSCLM
jgi:hypothetical protein